MKVAVINTTQRKDSYSKTVSKIIVDELIRDGSIVYSSQIDIKEFADEYLKGYTDETFEDIKMASKVIFAIPSYYKNMPPIFLEWLDRFSSEDLKAFDNKPILIVSVQAGKSIDSLPETIARNTICQAIKYAGFMSNISPNWVGITEEYYKENADKFRDKILDFINNYE